MRLLIALVFACYSTLGATPYEFLKSRQELANDRASKKAQQEKIIGGVATFVLGNIGFFSSEETTAKVAFSLFQTIGVIDLAKGIKSYYAPNQDAELFDLTEKVKNARRVDINKFSYKIVQIRAKQEKAKRMATLYGASFLTGQYLINSFVGNPPESLKNIYLFLAATNLMVAGNAYFSKSDFEKYYFNNKLSLAPILPRNSRGPGLLLSTSF